MHAYRFPNEHTGYQLMTIDFVQIQMAQHLAFVGFRRKFMTLSKINSM